MKRADIDLGDLVVHVAEWGNGDPLVLVHGFTGSSEDWGEVAPALAADGRRVLAVDLRGHGLSTKTADPARYTFDQLTGDLTRTLDAHDLASVDLLGHSMGGVIAQMFVIAHPDRVRSLVLMDTAARPAGGIPTDWRELLAAVALEDGMSAVWERFGAGFAADLDPRRAKRLRAAFEAVDPHAFVELGQALVSYPSLLDALGALECPTTVIVGELDAGLRDAAVDLAAAIPGAALEVIEAAGHSPQIDQPEAWLAAVRGHMSRLDQQLLTEEGNG